jgi:hypothetical protein
MVLVSQALLSRQVYEARQIVIVPRLITIRCRCRSAADQNLPTECTNIILGSCSFKFAVNMWVIKGATGMMNLSER